MIEQGYIRRGWPVGVSHIDEFGKGKMADERKKEALEELKGLMGRAPENNSETREWSWGTGQTFGRKEDVVTLYWSGNEQQSSGFRLLKQKGKIIAGDASIVLEADSTAAQIAKLIYVKGRKPERLNWNRIDAVFDEKGILKHEDNIPISCSFKAVEIIVSEAARGLDSKYANKSLQAIGKDLCEQDVKKEKKFS